ncbi:TPA: thiolase family protein [Candidatus Thalassarchaeaceae archaeon]|jgi:acetyl-CoA C-acetyltransferase|nr:acetyl-CoA C-acyltransferase [Euryarchaeota archaeon]DAC66521.1 MAG TPA: thiolase family protein [Candidatus Poseidoniales archaeon]HII43554.1 thiolase family protein [Candidatus Thalassarchaeaceae archaeon]|tara:strand:- start:1959 stop:3116 length:1158 start_codon:yes stop_codon:yes gene_type:complete
MTAPVICAYARTPFGRYRGALARYSATELGTLAVKELLERAAIDAASGIVDQLYMGQVLQAGAGQAPARQVAIGAGLPYSTPCTTVNKVCGSSLKAAMIGATEIMAGRADVVIAGGMESMSNAPHFIRGARRGDEISYGDLSSILSHDGLKDAYDESMMGVTGETIAREADITREQSDAFAVRSHTLSNQAWDQGWFAEECLKIDGLSRDEGIRTDTSTESLASLKTVFDKEGQVTAGNASQVSDGGSAVLIASETAAATNGWPVLARIVDFVTSGVEPHRVMSAPIPAIKMLLERNGLAIADIDILEHNEAFAAASCAVKKAFDIPDEKFNPHGGAVAMGHPLGATGARCLMTLTNALNRTGGHRGIVTICLGGGNAVGMLIEV